jgi:hypothetical protein
MSSAPPSNLTTELARAAAQWIVEEGMEYGPAKQRAARQLHQRHPKQAQLPNNQHIEEEVRAYIDLFCSSTQPHELYALRTIAVLWMERLQAFRPHLTGAVWRGTATRLSAVHLQLFCDDSKEAEMQLLNQKVSFDIGSIKGPRSADIDVLTLSAPSHLLKESVTVHLSILDFDDLRGPLKYTAAKSPHRMTERGDITQLRQLMESTTP